MKIPVSNRAILELSRAKKNKCAYIRIGIPDSLAGEIISTVLMGGNKQLYLMIGDKIRTTKRGAKTLLEVNTEESDKEEVQPEEKPVKKKRTYRKRKKKREEQIKIF